MLQLQVPALLHIRGGITVNLNNSVSQAVEKQVPQRRIKETSRGALENRERPVSDDDYEEYAKMDTISFWFIGGTSLAYRVGEEITAEDYDRIAGVLTDLNYRVKNERKPSNKPNPKKT